MTLEELLNTIGFHFESNKFERQNNQLLKFNILIEHNEHFAIDYQYGITKANLVDIDNNEQTITLKYRYKG